MTQAAFGAEAAEPGAVPAAELGARDEASHAPAPLRGVFSDSGDEGEGAPGEGALDAEDASSSSRSGGADEGGDEGRAARGPDTEAAAAAAPVLPSAAATLVGSGELEAVPPPPPREQAAGAAAARESLSATAAFDGRPPPRRLGGWSERARLSRERVSSSERLEGCVARAIARRAYV